jgi:aryl-alcohol dehydrogenase (NADP+)
MIYTQRKNGWAEFVTMQNHYNLIYREEEREMNPFCVHEGIALIPWSPLARGFLAGNRRRGHKDATLRERHDDYGHSLYYADADYDVADKVVEVAVRKGVAPIQVGLAWILGRPGVTAPIISVTRREQLDGLIPAASMDLTADEIRAVESAYRPHPIIGHD